MVFYWVHDYILIHDNAYADASLHNEHWIAHLI